MSASRPIALTLTGMHCAACSSRIEKVVSRMDGVAAMHVNLATGSGTVQLAPDAPHDTLQRIFDRIAGMGFGGAVATAEDSRTAYLRQQAKEQADLAAQKKTPCAHDAANGAAYLYQHGAHAGLALACPSAPAPCFCLGAGGADPARAMAGAAFLYRRAGGFVAQSAQYEFAGRPRHRLCPAV